MEMDSKKNKACVSQKDSHSTKIGRH